MQQVGWQKIGRENSNIQYLSDTHTNTPTMRIKEISQTQLAAKETGWREARICSRRQQKRHKETNRRQTRRWLMSQMNGIETGRVYKKRSPCTFAGAVLLNQLTKSKFLWKIPRANIGIISELASVSSKKIALSSIHIFKMPQNGLMLFAYRTKWGVLHKTSQHAAQAGTTPRQTRRGWKMIILHQARNEGAKKETQKREPWTLTTR